MVWTVVFFPDFEQEFDILSPSVQDGLFARLVLLEREGPSLGRPHADTLIGSQHANMKELRYTADGGVWRIAFAFDTERKAVLLVAGDKAGRSEKRFYRQLISKADERFNRHLFETKDN
jgi:hypothetical protein